MVLEGKVLHLPGEFVCFNTVPAHCRFEPEQVRCEQPFPYLGRTQSHLHFASANIVRVQIFSEAPAFIPAWVCSILFSKLFVVEDPALVINVE